MLRSHLGALESALRDKSTPAVDWEQALRQLKEVNFALDEALIVAITDTFGNITFANQKFCEISKYSHDELIGQNHRVLNSGYHSSTFFRDLWKTITAGNVWRGEICDKAKDGTIYWMDTTIVPSKGDDGVPYQYVSFRNDITDRKMAEEALRRAEKISAVGLMASGIVHEIRNPLAAMKWSLQLLEIDVPERTEELHAILSELDRVDEIVGQLLTLSKPHEVPFEVRDISGILDVVVGMMRGQAKRQKADLLLAVHQDAPLVRCEPNQLKQVFMNIIKNAIESMPNGGIVKVSASKSRSGELDIQISDQGCGMPEEVAARLGEPFLTTKQKGTGLGMMVSYQIIRNHHGRIDVNSQLGKGTTITISMPSAVGDER